MRILIVDDDYGNRRVLESIFSAHGECVLAADGTDALARYVESFDAEMRFDLVLLDVMMPGCDGHEVLKTIRQEEERRGIMGRNGAKIVMVTALEDKASVLGAFRSGCEAYVVKPIDREKLIRTVQDLGLIAQG